jgi:PilZ domain-containing protein
MNIERRGDRRRIVRHPATILGSDGSSRHSCMMLDVSATGAKLELLAACEVADVFTLVLTESGNVYRECKISWRSELSMGVQFIGERSNDKVWP